MRYISKRAELLDALKDAVISLWDVNAGPFENIMGGMSSFIPFVPGLGWTYFFLEKLVGLAGYGMGDWGRWIDSHLGLGPGSDISLEDVPRAAEKGLRALTVKSSANKNGIEKAAFWGALAKLPIVVKALWTLIRVLVTALGVRKISEVYKHPEILRKDQGSIIQNILPGQQMQQVQQLQPQKLAPDKKDSGESDIKLQNLDIGKIKDFFSNPLLKQQTLGSNNKETIMSWEKSEIMREFFKIAEKDELLKTAAPSPNPNQEDKKVIEEKRQKSSDKNIIDEAHPESVYIAEARGDGGLVENANEQQKKLIEMINKMPTGSLVGRYASIAAGLIKMADACDEVGHEEAADKLTDVAEKILEMATQLPFEEAPAED